MLVFELLKLRNFHIEIRNKAKDDATGVLYYSPVVYRGQLMPSVHLFGVCLYACCVGVSFLVYFNWFPKTTTGDDAKVQIPTLYFCGQR